MKSLVQGARKIAIDRVLSIYSLAAGISLRRLLPIYADNDIAPSLMADCPGSLNPTKEPAAAPADYCGATSEKATNIRPVVLVGIQLNGGIILGAN